MRRITLQHIVTLALTATLVTAVGQGTAAASDPQWESPRPSPTQQ